MDFTTILSESRRFSKQNSNTYPTADVTESANRAMDRMVTLIREAEGRWQWDDSNYTDLPFAVASLVASQQDYSLDSAHYRIERVEVKDSAGGWTKLTPIDQADVYNAAVTSFLSGTGIPQYYDKIGNSVLLYPKPSYSQASSLKVFYERGPSYFTVADTTKEPGFNKLFHRLVPLHAAHDYAVINQMPLAISLSDEIAKWEDQLAEFYSKRDKDEHTTLKARVISYR